MKDVLELAEFLGASAALWVAAALCYRGRTPRDPAELDRWPVECHEPAAAPTRTAAERSAA